MRRWIGAAITLAVLGAAWWWLWPTELGGRTAYAVTHGVSMLPRFHTGDLAVIRPADEYEIGDVVAYHSPTINSVVLHRIVERDGNGFITKGDHNTWLDPDRPTADDMLGTLSVRVPRGGKVLESVTEPMSLAAIAAVILLLTGRQVSRHARRRTGTRRRPSSGLERLRLPASGIPTPALAAGAALGTAMLGLGGASVFQPSTVPVTRSAPVDQTATITYGGKVARGPVYPSGRLSTGDPIFLRLVDAIDIHVAVSTAAPAISDLSSKRTVVAVLAANTGWKHEETLVATAANRDGSFDVTARLDLKGYARLINTIDSSTGVGSTYTLTVRTEVQTGGVVQGKPVTSRFAPSIAFDMGRDQLKPTTPGADGSGNAAAPAASGATGVVVREAGRVNWSATQPGTMSIFGRAVPVSLARQLGAVGTVLALGCVAMWLAGRRRRPAQTEAATILRRYGERIIPVTGVAAPEGRTVVEVPSMDSLAKIAEKYERFILHTSDESGDHFSVDDDTTLYRYRPAANLGGSLPLETELPLQTEQPPDGQRSTKVPSAS